jgi:hypothetical protein
LTKTESQKFVKAKLQRLNRKTKNAKAEMPKQKQKAGGRETPPAFFKKER